MNRKKYINIFDYAYCIRENLRSGHTEAARHLLNQLKENGYGNLSDGDIINIFPPSDKKTLHKRTKESRSKFLERLGHIFLYLINR